MTKKKRVPKKQVKIENQPIEPIETIIFEEDGELKIYFNFSNKALKMLKVGSGLERSFLKDNMKTTMHFLHRDVFDEKHRNTVNLRRKLAIDRKMQIEKQKSEQKYVEQEKNLVE